MTAVTVVKVVRKIKKTLNKNIKEPPFFIFSVLLESAIFAFDNQCDVPRALFCNSRNVFEKRLHDFMRAKVACFSCEEVEWFYFGGEVAGSCVKEILEFCEWRGCMIFVCGEVAWFFSFAHSLRLHDLFFSGGWVIFFCAEDVWFLVEILRDFLC